LSLGESNVVVNMIVSDTITLQLLLLFIDACAVMWYDKVINATALHVTCDSLKRLTAF